MERPGGEPPADGAPPTGEDVSEQLTRVLSSEVFTRAKRTHDFLDYVVHETLAGRGERLKERTVGRWALDLPATYDSRLDASVRVRAARVRQALDQYYADEGADDPVAITLPRGSYVPSFGWRRHEHPSDATALTSIAVDIEGEPGLSPDGSDGFRRSLTAALDAYPSLKVMAGPGAATRYRLRVSPPSDHDDRGWSVNLVDTLLDTSVWHEALASGQGSAERLARRVAAVVGDYGGLIPRRSIVAPATGSDPAVDATLLFYRWADSHRIEHLVAAIPALDAAAAGSDNVLLWSYAAAARAELVLGQAAEREPTLTEADALIEGACLLSPGHPAPILAAALVALARDQHTAAAANARSVVADPLLDPSLVLAAAVILAAAGDIDAGTSLARECHRRHATSAGYQHVFLMLGWLMEFDAAAAMAHAALLPVDAEIRPLLKAVGMDALGHRDEALALLRRESSNAVRLDHWTALTGRMWDIPPAWRDDLLNHARGLLAAGSPDHTPSSTSHIRQ